MIPPRITPKIQTTRSIRNSSCGEILVKNSTEVPKFLTQLLYRFLKNFFTRKNFRRVLRKYIPSPPRIPSGTGSLPVSYGNSSSNLLQEIHQKSNADTTSNSIQGSLQKYLYDSLKDNYKKSVRDHTTKSIGNSSCGDILIKNL